MHGSTSIAGSGLCLLFCSVFLQAGCLAGSLSQTFRWAFEEHEPNEKLQLGLKQIAASVAKLMQCCLEAPPYAKDLSYLFMH